MKFSSSGSTRVGDNEVSMVRKLLFLVVVTAACLFAQQPEPDALFQTAVNHLASKQYEEAAATFRRLRGMEPGGVRAALGVSQTLMAQGLRAEAIAYMTGEVAKDSLNPKLNVALGDIALQAGDINTALARYGRTLELLSRDPNAAGFYVKRSSKRGADKATDPLAAALDNFIGADPTPPGPAGVMLRLAETFLRAGDGQRGIVALEGARHYLPADPGLLMDLAVLYDRSKDQPRAIAAYRDLLKVAPDNGAALNNLAYLLAETGTDLEEALRDALRARELHPEADEVADTLGWVYVKREAYPEAVVIFSRLVQKSPEKINYRSRLLLVLELMGDKSAAVAELKAALATKPDEAANLALSALIVKLYPAR